MPIPFQPISQHDCYQPAIFQDLTAARTANGGTHIAEIQWNAKSFGLQLPQPPPSPCFTLDVLPATLLPVCSGL